MAPPQRDPRERPKDPAGTRPKHEPQDLLPQTDASLLWTEAVAEAPVDDPTQPRPLEWENDPVLASPAADPEPARGPVPDPGWMSRIHFVTGALLAVALAAAGVVALLLTDSDTTSRQPSGPAWSTWKPTPAGGDGPTQIAEHIGRQYRLPTGEQLVAVTGGPLEVAELPLTIALRDTKGDIQLVDGGGVLYRLCGLGPKCAIAKGKPSSQRHLLLRREALELALYSFRYIKDVENAVVFLPPRKGEDPTQALWFRKDDLSGSLNRPLSATLRPKTPTVSSVSSSPDATLVNTITTRGLFQFSLTQANQDTRAFLVLEPLKGG